jgi:hypothetical protein
MLQVTTAHQLRRPHRLEYCDQQPRYRSSTRPARHKPHQKTENRIELAGCQREDMHGVGSKVTDKAMSNINMYF